MRKLIGDRKFYKMLFAIAIPIMIQNGITTFVGLLDNIMVGGIGTVQMSGVAIANQLLFVFNLCIFGGLSGAGIFTAQYFGKGDMEGVRHTFRFKLYVCLLLCTAAIAVLLLKSRPLIGLFLTGEGTPSDIEATYGYAQQYLYLMLLQIIPFAAAQLYSSTLRECGNTKIPMAASLSAVFTNLVFNWVLIYGRLGFPKLGVVGAAVATIISRFVELGIILFAVYRNLDRFPYFRKMYRTLRIPARLVKLITIKGMPLLCNEFLWSFGVSLLSQCYSTRGLAVVAATNISQTVSRLSDVVFFSMGSAVSIIVGQLLGANKIEEAKDTDRKIIFFATAGCVVTGAITAAAAPFFPLLYNVTDEVRALATQLILITAMISPLHSFNNCAYFTLRSGGKTLITVLLDCGFMWAASIPVAYCLSRFTSLPILPLYLICQALELLKCCLAGFLLRHGNWAVNMVKEE